MKYNKNLAFAEKCCIFALGEAEIYSAFFISVFFVFSQYLSENFQ